MQKRPILLCLASADLPIYKISDMQLISAIRFKLEEMTIAGGRVMSLTGRTHLRTDNQWGNKFYKEINTKYKPVTIKLIPYYAWANRGKTDMRVWLPFVR